LNTTVSLTAAYRDQRGRGELFWDSRDVDHFEMSVQRIAAHPNVEANAGKLAIQVGPLVFAAEAIDNGGTAHDLVLPTDADLTTRFDSDLLGGMLVVEGSALRNGTAVSFTAIPYFAWANRGQGEMAVWLPTGEGGE
jgi:DUF1680 family protein